MRLWNRAVKTLHLDSRAAPFAKRSVLRQVLPNGAAATVRPVLNAGSMSR